MNQKPKNFQINNRRYLGNKYKLLPFIENIIKNECSNLKVFADIFSGTGSVSSLFTDKVIITNDILYSNYICNYAWFSSEPFNSIKIRNYIDNYNQLTSYSENYMTENFSNTYFSKNVCSKIGFIREDIEMNFKKNKLNFREKAILITSLLYSMDKIAATCGHYDSFRKGALFNNELNLLIPKLNYQNNPLNQCYNEDANQLVKRIKADLVYIDPPYNSRQYCDTYHLLENVARWEKPEVFGVARKMNRNSLKSNYCTKQAANTFSELIKNIKAHFILLSYNNMANNGADRSNARITDNEILNILEQKGSVKIFKKEFKSFTTGKSMRTDNIERLFLCKVY